MSENDEPTFEELMAKADDGTITSGEIEKALQDYAHAVKSEFDMVMAEKPENAEEARRDFCRNHLGHALAQIHWLTIHADSESVRLSASKYIADNAIKEADKDGDPIKQIMAELMGTSNP